LRLRGPGKRGANGHRPRHLYEFTSRKHVAMILARERGFISHLEMPR
jgi:hypothetical protein